VYVGHNVFIRYLGILMPAESISNAECCAWLPRTRRRWSRRTGWAGGCSARGRKNSPSNFLVL